MATHRKPDNENGSFPLITDSTLVGRFNLANSAGAELLKWPKADGPLMSGCDPFLPLAQRVLGPSRSTPTKCPFGAAQPVYS